MPRTWRRCSARTSSRSSRRPTSSSSTRRRRSIEQQKIDISTPGRAHPPCRAILLQRPAHRRLLRRRGQGPRRRLQRGPRHPRRRRQRLDHRPQHLPAPARGGAEDARHRSSASIRARRERAHGRRAPLSHHAAGARSGGVRRRGSPRRSMPATSPACSFASRMSTTTRSAAPPTCCGRSRSRATSPSS